MNLHTGRFFCLPDGYEVPAAQTSSLADVLRCLRPTFAHEEIVRDVGRNAALARDVHGMRRMCTLICDYCGLEFT